MLERYLAEGRMDDLLEVVRGRFSEAGNLGSFDRLRRSAQRLERREAERAAAISVLRERSAQPTTNAANASGRARVRWRAVPTPPPHEDLVGALGTPVPLPGPGSQTRRDSGEVGALCGAGG